MDTLTYTVWSLIGFASLWWGFTKKRLGPALWGSILYFVLGSWAIYTSYVSSDVFLGALGLVQIVMAFASIVLIGK